MFEATVGCFFFGTPFGGADAAAAAALFANIAEKMKLEIVVSSKLLDQMKPGDESLRDLKNEFMRLASKFKPGIEVVCFYEEQPTDFAEKTGLPDLFGLSRNIIPKKYSDFVTRESATLPGVDELGLARNHRDLVKFDSFKDELYQVVRSYLKRTIHGAPLSVKSRVSSSRDIDRVLVHRLLGQLEGASVQKLRQTLGKALTPSTWILNESIFLEWLAKESAPRDHNSATATAMPGDFLWIRGREGRGKTKVLLAALDHIESVIRDDEDENNNRGQEPLRLAYFFCDSAEDCRTAEDLLKSLIRQLIVQQETLVAYTKVFDKKSDKEDRALMSVELLWRTLQDMLSDKFIGRTVYFVVNNLHVLPEDSSSTAKFLSFLRSELQDVKRGVQGRVSVRWLFTSKEVNSIREAIQPEGSRLVDLEDPKYEDKVQLELKSHAEKKILALRDEKKYNKALAYFASSLLGKRAQNMQWIDITCVQLQQLPEMESELKVRRALEGKPQDLTTLLDQAWDQVFHKAGSDDCEVIKEMLRALVLAYEDPSSQELALLTGVEFAEAEAKEKLEKLIDGCKPLLEIKRVKGESRVGFMSAVVKSHLAANRGKHLGLSDDETKWHHGVLALRCFAHIIEQLGREDLVPENADNESEPAEPEEDGEAASTVGSDDESSPAEGTMAGDSDEDENDDDSDYDSEVSDTESEDFELKYIKDVALAYPVKHWLQHAGDATSEIAESLSLEDGFWKPESFIRRRWLLECNRLTGALEDFGHCRTWTGLHTAAAFGSVELLAALLKNGHEVERELHDEFQNTPLHAAAYYGNLDIIEELLNGGSNINDGLQSKSSTPLHEAAYQSHIPAMAKLVRRGAALDAVDDEVGPIVNAAILSGNTEAIKLLVDCGVSLTTEYRLAPLALAAGVSDLDVLNFLIGSSKEALPAEEYDKALVEAAKYGSGDNFRRLLEFPHPDECFQEALDAAALEGEWEIATSILKTRAGLNCGDAFCEAASSPDERIAEMKMMWEYTNGSIPVERLEEALYEASDMEKEQTVRLLVEELKVNPNAAGEEYGNALTASAHDGTMNILKLLLDAGAHVNSPNGWALQTAAAEGHIDIVRELLDRKANVDECVVNDEFSDGTALQAACEAGHSEIVRMLLEHKADPNLGPPGTYPIIAATEKGEHDIVEQLVKAGADVNVTGGNGFSSNPLINAASYMAQESIQLLLDAGADLELPDEDGDTALIAASSRPDVDCVRFLISQGANAMHCNNNNENALQVALDNEMYLNLDLLVKRTAAILKAVDTAVKEGNKAVATVVRSVPVDGEGLEYDDPKEDGDSSPDLPGESERNAEVVGIEDILDNSRKNDGDSSDWEHASGQPHPAGPTDQNNDAIPDTQEQAWDSWKKLSPDIRPEEPHRHELPGQPSYEDRTNYITQPVRRKPIGDSHVPSIQQIGPWGETSTAEASSVQSFSQGYQPPAEIPGAIAHQPIYQPGSQPYGQQQQQQQNTRPNTLSGWQATQTGQNPNQERTFIPYNPVPYAAPQEGTQRYYQQPSGNHPQAHYFNHAQAGSNTPGWAAGASYPSSSQTTPTPMPTPGRPGGNATEEK